ncbi:HalOD1 output domain-containing protein [Halobellus ordinarius]|uniref:HalOD1 output domain-containing protein n=1 Tax=Halobellus ordinarius TaxID=3075120 RepID=UPI0028804C07|nr:HalOD1 output domain-containing protein [Halobellus sp. ZY16]
MTSSTKPNESPDRDAVASDHVTFSEETGTYWTEFDGHTRQPTEAVVFAVAEATQTDPLDLPPLCSALDPDALNMLFETSTNSRPQATITVSFEYADHQIVLKEHGSIVVTPPAPGR